MKSMKKNALLVGAMVAVMALAGCNNNTPASTNGTTTSSHGPSTKLPDSIPAEVFEEGLPFDEEVGENWPSYTVTFDYQGNGTNATQTVKYKHKLEKPADPTAPAGKKFYGWMNAADGGRIWNFKRKSHASLTLIKKLKYSKLNTHQTS